jgi:hypothetical protein
MARHPRDWSYLAMISGRSLDFWMLLPVRVHTHEDRSTATTRLVTSRYTRTRQTRICQQNGLRRVGQSVNSVRHGYIT